MRLSLCDDGALHVNDGAQAETSGMQAIGPLCRQRSSSYNAEPVQQPAGPAQPVMIVLVGAPGSGKSTFAESLVKQSTLAWRRVNQVLICRACYYLPGHVHLHVLP